MFLTASVSPPGLGFVWECQGISVSPFYLCESCKEMIIHYKICEHMRSYDHQLQYIWMQHPDFLYFWDYDFLLKEMKQDIVEGIAMMLSKRERYYKVDAQCILLRPGAFEHVKSLSFSEALKLVKDLKKDPKLDWQTSFTAQQKGFSWALMLTISQGPHEKQDKKQRNIIPKTLLDIWMGSNKEES
ncbi:hypothetical protein NQZ68_001801 [Dissostichus eleginoides]|nr:hypothetical protein NQZ68_001801 [Dissostichus eleginoides]